MVYIATVLVKKEEIEKANKLLALDDLRQMNEDELEKTGAKVNDIVHILSVKFENDFQLDIDVCSGNMHYYDNCVLRNSCGYEVDCFDSKYFIGDTMEFSHGYDTYVVEIEK